MTSPDQLPLAGTKERGSCLLPDSPGRLRKWLSDVPASFFPGALDDNKTSHLLCQWLVPRFSISDGAVPALCF